MRYVSLFSGVEAASVAWESLGWEPAAFSEIEPFPCAVLEKRFPNVPNLGDITKIDWKEAGLGTVDLVVGGSPCFVAGTLVMTSGGLKPIEEVEVGDLVLTHKGRLRKVLVTGSKMANTVFLKGHGSCGIECTPNHPFLSRGKTDSWNNQTRSSKRIPDEESVWTRADGMEGRFWLNVCECETMPVPSFDESGAGQRGKGYIEDFEMGEDFFYFVGRWLGDGWLSQHRRKGRVESIMKCVFVCCAKEKTEYLAEKLGKTGLHFCMSEERTTNRFCCSSTQLFDWLLANFDKGASEKNIPAWCLGMDPRLRQAILRGYRESDGCDLGTHWAASSVSKKLSVGVKMLAGSLGMTTSVVLSDQKREHVIEGRRVNMRPQYVQSYWDKSRSAFFAESGWFGKVKSVKPAREHVQVFNLEVEDDNSYTADGIAVHNCQSFSIAGNREGLKGESGLMFEYIRAVRELMPRVFVWENVPGALSSEGGAAFGQLLSEMDDLGYGLAWRVLDAQFFGVAQRRRRVFLVGCLGDPERAAEILFERESLRWNYPSSRDKRKALATGSLRGAVVDCLEVDRQERGDRDGEGPGAVREGWQAADCAYTLQVRCGCAGGGKGALVQEDVSATLATHQDQTLFQAVNCLTPWETQTNRVYGDGCFPAVCANNNGGMNRQAICHPQAGTTKCGGDPSFVAHENGTKYVVRRLTPMECERLQGFPDGWTDVEFKGKPAKDTHRYKAMGNSMAVPVMRWIGERIQKGESN